MTDPAVSAGTSGTSWRVVNLVLIVVAVLLVVGAATIVGLALRRDPAPPPDPAPRFAAVERDARAETLAFLQVDYKNMDPLIDKVLAGATGAFKEQYGGARATLKSSVVTSQATSTGKVRAVGIGDLTGSQAVVFVAADSQVTNKSTGGQSKPRYYRLKLTMVEHAGRWLTSDLQFVG